MSYHEFLQKKDQQIYVFFISDICTYVSSKYCQTVTDQSISRVFFSNQIFGGFLTFGPTVGRSWPPTLPSRARNYPTSTEVSLPQFSALAFIYFG